MQQIHLMHGWIFSRHFPRGKEKAEAAKEYGEKVEEEIQDKTDELKDEEKRMYFSYLTIVTLHL